MAIRHAHIDRAKGIGILFVVFGHNWFVLHEKGELFNVIFSFHMPLFFFLSGIFMELGKSLPGYANRKFDSYLKPYGVTFLLLGLIMIPLEGINPVGYFAKIVYGTGSIIPWRWVQLWFLPHLWAVSVFSYLLCRYTDIQTRPTSVKAILLVLFLATGFLGIKAFWNIPLPGTDEKIQGLPFSVDVILLSSFYFILGFFYKQDVVDLKFNLPAFTLIAFAFGLIHFQTDYTMDLNLRRYDHVFMSTIEALTGIYLILSLAALCKSRLLISGLLSYLGSASLIILIFHNYIQAKSFNLFTSLLGEQNSLNAILSFGTAILVPVMFFEVMKRNPVLSKLYLPVRTGSRFSGMDGEKG